MEVRAFHSDLNLSPTASTLCANAAMSKNRDVAEDEGTELNSKTVKRQDEEKAWVRPAQLFLACAIKHKEGSTLVTSHGDILVRTRVSDKKLEIIAFQFEQTFVSVKSLSEHLFAK